VGDGVGYLLLKGWMNMGKIGEGEGVPNISILIRRSLIS